MNAYKHLRNMPVAINNYFGDPVLQWDNTLEKVRILAEDKHLGQVGIITKGKISLSMARELKSAAKDLNLIVLVSISGLKNEVEPIGQAHRYRTLESVIFAGIPAIGYIRPIVPPFNTDNETILNMFRNIKGAGCSNVVVSGFRGDDNIIDLMKPDQKQEWVLRVKLMSSDLSKLCRDMAERYDLQMFTRTSCGIAMALNMKRSFNPYYISPRGAECHTCPMRNTCGHIEPNPESIEFLRSLGYDIDYVSNQGQTCQVDPAHRLDCLSCCTSCFVIKDVPRIVVKNKGVRLGDIAFIRFITGVLTSKENVVDGGDSKVAHVNFPAMKMPDSEVHCINTWYVWAYQKAKCFQCRYCITSVYKLDEREYGCSPKQLANYIDEAMHV